ncbi:hypothetical protein TNCV_2646801 [Trichonephila clavipes]|nr:hypothetical protein TNCV_2646801 [Trichonephila clavipes]
MYSMVPQRLTQITPPTATPDQLWQRVEASWSAVPQEHIKSLFESMPRRVAAKIPEGSKLANMVANEAKLVANLIAKNDANLTLPPRFRQVLIELPL